MNDPTPYSRRSPFEHERDLARPAAVGDINCIHMTAEMAANCHTCNPGRILPTLSPTTPDPVAVARAALDAAESSCRSSGRTYRDPSFQSLPVAPGPAVCRERSEHSDRLADAIRAIDPAAIVASVTGREGE